MICDFGKCPCLAQVVARELENRRNPVAHRPLRLPNRLLPFDSELEWPSFTLASWCLSQ